LIETDEQRRWWFATHPEFSSSRNREKRRRHDDEDEDEDSGRPAPERVDEMADERLENETDPVRRTLLELTKYYFGTEFQSKTPAEKEAILRQDEDWPDDAEKPANAAGNDRRSQQADEAQARDEGTSLSYRDVLDYLDKRQEAQNAAKGAFIHEMLRAGWSRERAEERWNVYKLNEDVARGVSDTMTVHGAASAARAILSGAFKWFIGLGEVGAIGRIGPRLPPKGTPERAKIDAARNLGVRRKKAQELSDIRAGGRGSGAWKEEELEEIRRSGEFPIDAQWHHDPTVANRPDLAADPRVVYVLRGGREGHLRDGHNMDWRNPKQ